MVIRIPTGIPGLDSLIQGGLVKNSVNLVTGTTGTGKTIFCCQFLWYGLNKGEPCVFLSLEEEPTDIKSDARQFGWDFDKFEKKDLFKIFYHDPFEVSDISSVLIDEIEHIDAKRVAIDSASILGMYIRDLADIRKRLFKIIRAIKDAGCTSLVTSEILEDSKALSRFGVEEFIVDGIIVLYYTGIGEEVGWNLEIRKMRKTKHTHGFFPLEFTNKGLVVKREGISVLMK